MRAGIRAGMSGTMAPVIAAQDSTRGRMGIMQPYFLPYIGYWQLIHACERFILLDDVQYIRHGWVNRNRILKHGGGWQYITVPLRRHALEAPIRDIEASAERDWKGLILRQLAHYRYLRAPHFGEVMELLTRAFASIGGPRLSHINLALVRELADYLGLRSRIELASEMRLSYDEVRGAGDWAPVIASQLGAREYVNPVGGAGLFDPAAFERRGLGLSLLRTADVAYEQAGASEPSLSIVDVLMFNGREGTRRLLERYDLVGASGAAEADAASAR